MQPYCDIPCTAPASVTLLKTKIVDILNIYLSRENKTGVPLNTKNIISFIVQRYCKNIFYTFFFFLNIIILLIFTALATLRLQKFYIEIFDLHETNSLGSVCLFSIIIKNIFYNMI